MLKTLRITSLAAVILAACGVLVTAFFGFKDDPEKASFLKQPSVTEKFKGQETKADQKEGDIHPLVTQAKAFALRINPPPPPPPPPPKNPPPKPAAKPELARQVTPPAPPRPPVVNASFQVLATVRYETDPFRSLVLLKSGNTHEWFRQGEKAGHLTIDDIRDGSVVVSQAGRSPQTLYVPAKQESKSLLKGDKTAVASARPSTATVPGAAVSSAAFVSEDGVVNAAPASAARSRTMTSRVGRVRAQPPVPTPAQKKEELEQTITGIEDIMNRQDAALDDEQRQAENLMWMELLKTLKAEKQHLAAAEKTDVAAAEEAGQSESTPAAEESSEFGETGQGEEMPAEPAGTEDQTSFQGEGESASETAETDPLFAEGEEGAGEADVAGEGEGNGEGEGFAAAAQESGRPAETDGPEGQSPAGFGDAVPNEY